jgi:hypothetical protein
MIWNPAGSRMTVSINFGEDVVLRPLFGAFSSPESQIHRSRRDSKTLFRRPLQRFASEYTSPRAPVPGRFLTFQSEPAFSLETVREEPKVDVSL